MTAAQVLAGIDLFAGLSEGQLKTLAVLAKEETCARGQALFEEGSPATHLYLLLAGKITIQVQLTSRPQAVEIAVLSRPGQLVGWSGLVPPHHYTATAVCMENSRLLAMDGKALMHALEDDPGMGFLIMRRISEVISGRLRNIQQVVLKTL